jgi:hypothetical protein
MVHDRQCERGAVSFHAGCYYQRVTRNSLNTLNFQSDFAFGMAINKAQEQYLKELLVLIYEYELLVSAMDSCTLGAAASAVHRP